MKIPELCKSIGELTPRDFILMEQNMNDSENAKFFSIQTAQQNKQILDILKILYLAIDTARIQKVESEAKVDKYG